VKSHPPHRIVVIASGAGTNFVAIADAVKSKAIPDAEIVGLICDRPGAPVIQSAKDRKIRTQVIDSRTLIQNEGRGVYDLTLLDAVHAFQPNWICLAGYMRILDRSIVEAYGGRILNVHPSLLPKYRGLKAQKQAIDAGEKETGCTVHVVTAELDAGPILVQKRIAIQPTDDEKSLSERLKPLEHEAYVEALKKVLK
jgi:phosphoribosylglycinamide formyltransferase 1